MKLNQDEFSQLKQLLAWKQGEQPPPGYFDDFSTRVIRQIHASQAMAAKSTWWRRLLDPFDPQPVLASAYALLIGALLLFGLSYSQMQEDAIAPTMQMSIHDSLAASLEAGVNDILGDSLNLAEFNPTGYEPKIHLIIPADLTAYGQMPESLDNGQFYLQVVRFPAQ